MNSPYYKHGRFSLLTSIDMFMRVMQKLDLISWDTEVDFLDTHASVEAFFQRVFLG